MLPRFELDQGRQRMCLRAAQGTRRRGRTKILQRVRIARDQPGPEFLFDRLGKTIFSSLIEQHAVWRPKFSCDKPRRAVKTIEQDIDIFGREVVAALSFERLSCARKDGRPSQIRP